MWRHIWTTPFGKIGIFCQAENFMIFFWKNLISTRVHFIAISPEQNDLYHNWLQINLIWILCRHQYTSFSSHYEMIKAHDEKKFDNYFLHSAKSFLLKSDVLIKRYSNLENFSYNIDSAYGVDGFDLTKLYLLKLQAKNVD